MCVQQYKTTMKMTIYQRRRRPVEINNTSFTHTFQPMTMRNHVMSTTACEDCVIGGIMVLVVIETNVCLGY